MYKWNPEDYHQHSSAQEQWAQELIHKLNLQGTEQVLDIGCGDGKITAGIARHLPQGFVLGIDSSSEMVEFASRKYPVEKYPNLLFMQMNASLLGFQEQFDIVFSNAALHWILDHYPVLEGISQSLKPSGKVLLQMGGEGNAKELFDIAEMIIQESPWAKYFTGFKFPYGFYNPGHYEAWLEKTGLLPQRIDLIPRDTTQPGEAGLAGWIRTTWLPYTGRLPEKLQESFIQELVSRYMIRKPLDEKGLVHIPMVRLEVEAVKP